MVYLLHFKSPFKHAKHYLGFCEKNEGLEARMERHTKGHGSKLVAAVTKAGIEFDIARTWPDADRNFERWLKNRKNTPELCPICNPNSALNRAKDLTVTKSSTETENSAPIVSPT